MMILTKKALYPFAKFYQPCNFSLDPSHHEDQSCSMAQYVGVYRKYGHLFAKLDPLGIYNKKYDEFVRPTDFGISFQKNLNEFKFSRAPVIIASKNIEDLQKRLIQNYLSYVGVEFEQVDTIEEKNWLYDNYEKIKNEQLNLNRKIQNSKILIQAQAFDHFLHKKFVTFKRYSGQGAQSTVLALQNLFSLAAQKDFKDIVFGMPHRGRLNTLVNLLQYPASHLFRKISGKTDTPEELHTCIDDVVSHIAKSTSKKYGEKEMNITMVHNPSHLEAQNPVSMGKTRSKQLNHIGDKVLNIQVHGDAAICAQGIVYESILLGKTPKFNTNGTIHLITNNQIGYTTKPIDSRGSKYASDVAKAFNIPIIHINTDSIEDVSKVMQLCIEYRQKFKKDIMVDLICYRKYGHNEVDEPQFTQPQMYHQIRKVFEPLPKRYARKLQESGVAKNLFASVCTQLNQRLESQFSESQKIENISLKDYTNPNRKGARAFTHQWKDMKPSLLGQNYPTGFDTNTLKEFAKASVYYPDDFHVHNRIKKYHIDERLKSIETNKLNWATCEALALFSLNYQGYNIRFTGQDVQRGTFSQRHLNLTDQKTEQQFNPLAFFGEQNPARGKVQIYNSALSQNGVMSYQYGFSLDNPMNFTVWEAQFGDFFNTAQVVVDNFLVNSESKWLRQTGLTLILPHGFDGAGPEHSSCRMERFLQLANSDGGLISYNLEQDTSKPLSIQEQKFYEDYRTANFSLVCPTKPSNIFHVLRRQMKRNFRKPLIIAGPKTLLRHSSCISRFEDLGPDSKFEELIGHKNNEKLNQKQAIILCAGKFVYDIEQIIKTQNAEKTSLYSIQQLFPFPEKKIFQILSQTNKSAQVYWVQEQNINSGAFYFVQRRINRVLKNLKFEKELKYVGRRAISATAVGSAALHKKEGQALNSWIKKIVV